MWVHTSLFQFNPLHPNISMFIFSTRFSLHFVRYCQGEFDWQSGSSKIGDIFFSLMPFVGDSRVILWEEIRSQSSLGVKKRIRNHVIFFILRCVEETRSSCEMRKMNDTTELSVHYTFVRWSGRWNVMNLAQVSEIESRTLTLNIMLINSFK